MKIWHVFLLAALEVEAFWRMRCSTIQVGRIDPVISPGTVSSHVHTIAGPINFNTSSSYDTLRGSFCSSCQIQDDKSAYWTPQLYYRHGNGTYITVRNDGTVVYYLGRGEDRANIIPFPPGFKMVSGDNGVRSYDNTTMTYGTATYPARPVADRVSFNCLTANYSPLPETSGMVRTDCPNGLRAQIQFQSCWDGVNLYKADQSHVAYLSQIDNGICPPTHPNLLPHLFYEIYYFPNEIDSSDGGQFMFSNGDTTGYGFHGDFLNGWNTSILQAGIDQCINSLESGVIEDCPPLSASNDPYFEQNCPLQPSLINEQISGVSVLPGCNQPFSGPARAPAPTCTTTPILNQVVNTDGWIRKQPTNKTVVAGAVYEGCFMEASGRALNKATYADDGMTTESCASYCQGQGFPVFGTEYARECYCGQQITTNQTVDSDCGMACDGNLTEYCGGPNRLSVWTFTNSTETATASSSIISTTPTKMTSSNTVDTASSSATPTVAISSPVNGTTYLGCHSDSPGSRSLTGGYTSSNNMTVEACATYAKGKNLHFFGLEYSGECFAGNSLSAAQIPESSCNMVCSGSSRETCGGPNAMSTYSNDIYVETSIPKTVTTANVQYTFVSCYTEGTSGRAIPDWAYTDSSMTVSSCISACYQNGFSYAALEYMHECYCDNKGITNGGSPAPDGDCNMLCDGDKTEFCGGANRLAVYRMNSSSRRSKRTGLL